MSTTTLPNDITLALLPRAIALDWGVKPDDRTFLRRIHRQGGAAGNRADRKRLNRLLGEFALRGAYPPARTAHDHHHGLRERGIPPPAPGARTRLAATWLARTPRNSPLAGLKRSDNRSEQRGGGSPRMSCNGYCSGARRSDGETAPSAATATPCSAASASTSTSPWTPQPYPRYSGPAGVARMSGGDHDIPLLEFVHAFRAEVEPSCRAHPPQRCVQVIHEYVCRDVPGGRRGQRRGGQAPCRLSPIQAPVGAPMAHRMLAVVELLAQAPPSHRELAERRAAGARPWLRPRSTPGR